MVAKRKKEAEAKAASDPSAGGECSGNIRIASAKMSEFCCLSCASLAALWIDECGGLPHCHGGMHAGD